MEIPNPFAKCDSNEEEEDTLSLSGLAMYGDQNLELWVEDPSIMSTYDVEEDFEFSSEMMITSRDSSNHVVFCGKIIHVSSHNNIQKFECTKQQKRRLKYPDDESRVVRKVSILASKTISRWYLFMFGNGSSRFPKEMQVRDLRKRRQTSLPKKGNHDCNHCDEYNRNATRSRAFIRFLSCGNGGIVADENEILCKHHLQSLMGSH